LAWMRLAQAAEYVNVSPRTIRRWMDEGLKHSRIHGYPYISEKWLDEWMESHAADNVEKIVNEVMEGIIL